VYEGHQVKVEVTGAEVVQNPYSRNVKFCIDNIADSIKYTAMQFACSIGLSVMAKRMA